MQLQQRDIGYKKNMTVVNPNMHLIILKKKTMQKAINVILDLMML